MHKHAKKESSESESSGENELDLSYKMLTGEQISKFNINKYNIIICSYNLIEKIPLFVHLEVLYLNNNNISDENLNIKFPSSLLFLDLSCNKKITQFPNNLLNCKKLSELHLYGCNINKTNILPNSIEILDLSYNPLEKLQELPESLIELNLMETKIREITIKLPKYLEILNLNGSNLEILPKKLPKYLSKLYVDNTNIYELPNNMSIEILSAKKTQISEFPTGLSNIKEINVSNTNISSLNNISQTNLIILNIKNTKITSLDTLPKFLEQLNICNCNITNIERIPKYLLKVIHSNSLSNSLINKLSSHNIILQSS